MAKTNGAKAPGMERQQMCRLALIKKDTHSEGSKEKLVRNYTGGASGKEPACQCRRYKRHRFDPWVGKIPWRRARQPTPVFLPGESHGQRSLVGCSPPESQRVRHD